MVVMRRGIRFNAGQIYTLENAVQSMQTDIKNVFNLNTSILKNVEKIASGYTRAKFSLDNICPFETREEIKSFCARDHQREEKRQALLDFMRLKGDDSSLTKYVYSLSRALFDPEYMARVRWPSER